MAAHLFGLPAPVLAAALRRAVGPLGSLGLPADPPAAAGDPSVAHPAPADHPTPADHPAPADHPLDATWALCDAVADLPPGGSKGGGMGGVAESVDKMVGETVPEAGML